MIETMILFANIRAAFQRNRWYIIGGLGLFGLVEVMGRMLGWS